MSGDRKPVWVWLPDSPVPVLAGHFGLERGMGSFSYDAVYQARADAVSLDPVSLPFNRRSRPARETRQGGLFGVFADACPDGFGLAMLEQRHGRTLEDRLLRMELPDGDAAGAVEVCDDIGRKAAFKAPSAAELKDVLGALPPQRPSSQAAFEVSGTQGTSLGGERPKLTVRHRGQLWIAKLQDRGDPPHAPLREFVAMRLAARCGIQAAEVEFDRVGDREVVLVRRFDRRVDEAGRTYRHLYASAHTVLRLDRSIPGDRNRSYLAFAHQLRRWCGADGVDVREMQREVWRRMAFNAICGNGDDHPRNHGLVHRDGHWRLADAFDIAPYITFSGALAMAVTMTGESRATSTNLLRDCGNFGYEEAEAAAYIEVTRQMVADGWKAELAAAGMPEDAVPVPAMDWLDRP